jgi:hypothetical protein
MDATANGPQEFTEFGYVVEYPDGSRDTWVDPLATARNPVSEFERERALGMFRTLEVGPEAAQLVFVSRRVTYTPWTDEETT